MPPRRWSGTTSGWDNSPRWATGPVEAVDLNSWLILDAQKLAGMASLLHKPSSEVDNWWQLANKTAALVQGRLWDEAAGVFFDRNPHTNKFITAITPATFFVLLPDGVATKAQAERMAVLLTNTSALSTPFPIPVVSRSDPAFEPSIYWRGPTWAGLLTRHTSVQVGSECLTRRCRLQLDQHQLSGGRRPPKVWPDSASRATSARDAEPSCTR